ncbi:TetR/AcrR family transcriptional regulator [Streptomyces hainanensis]|uniref:TetR/AcrR family transcriptional regulator n=1 Tax=Streptomyces hainanensis TaxID=402648 RepID=A0A4R4TEK8_9ACTN|nr:TetR/AcrR family transcriptional regulator [Streptomyces hainanensis]TDC75820.1 TetR/AcrR family transcriptional regulator [Streptomyces hainanensis]
MGRPKQFDPDTAVARAMDVFWRDGYAATTPQALADEMGIAKGSLYHAFGSKRALFVRALRQYGDTHAAELAELLHHQAVPVRERLRLALETLIRVDFVVTDRRGCFAVNTATQCAGLDDEAAAIVREMFDRTEGAFRHAIEEGQRTGELDPARDPRATASLLLNTVVGMRVLARTAEGPEQLHRVVGAALAAV